ncbi:MAG: EFR1 family ferrodoxin [Eubacterium sp.]|nr:EFR1 family ferrodoxin [Eubacterium sp.]
MNIQAVHAVFFSPTSTSRQVATALAQALAARLDSEVCSYDFTPPKNREQAPFFSEGDLVVLATPVYAGRVPNLMLPFIKAIKGQGALGIPVVLYGNRSYDDALMELGQLMTENGFLVVAAAAIVGQHSFSEVLAAGQPDAAVFKKLQDFSGKIWRKLDADLERLKPVSLPGNDPIHPYFKPLGPQGTPIDIRRVKPKTTSDCVQCKKCAVSCPMGAIDPEDARLITGICIKCHACVKGCPEAAKYFDDPDFVFHRQDIESRFASPLKPPEFYLN